jgi:hypothetical protein
MWYVINRPAEWLAQDTFDMQIRWLPASLRDGVLLSTVAIAAVFAWSRWPARTCFLLCQ